ncbi:calmodulin-4-like isoform X2 [Daktulosphaira vitifoliae]|uniref:calmodulin-4-like isoform X2 n=1 Tax=Daktulosphaira vitifoliae TaxID=58002 RepID=UPI0021A9839E|nr:calmodulin-4-like isoform X2 [Daktulosphaira vitifoliae]
MRCNNILLLICIYICITLSLAGKKRRVKNIKAGSLSKSVEVDHNNDEKLIESINKVNLSGETDEKSPSTEEEHNKPKTQHTLQKEENNVPEIRSTLSKNDITNEQIDLLTTIYNGVTSNDTKKLTVDILKNIFKSLGQNKDDKEYDDMMEYLDSENDGQTGLEKFLSLFLPKSQKENEKEMSTSTAGNTEIFNILSKGKSFITINDINDISKYFDKHKLLDYPSNYIEAIKKIAREKENSCITIEEFLKLTKNDV